MRIEIRRIYGSQPSLIVFWGSPKFPFHLKTTLLCKMWFFAAILASLLSVHVLAAPQDAKATLNRGPDRCGPEIQIPIDPLDTCLATPEPVASTSAFGILGIGNDQPYYYDWAACSDELVNMTCDTMVHPDAEFDKWYFVKGPADFPVAGTSPCSMGFWLPADPLASQPTVSRTPEQVLAQCKNIFGTLARAVASQTPDLAGGTINLVKNPSRQVGQYPLPGVWERQTGKATLL